MEQHMLTLDEPTRTRSVTVFHDERGFTSESRYGLHGMLAIPDHFVDDFGRELARIRRTHGYWHEIHFKDLGGSHHESSPDWLVARDWLNFLLQYGLETARFKAFAVDFRHEEFDRSRYPRPVHAYRRFAVTNAKSLIAWCLRGDGLLRVTAYTDAGNPHASRVRRRDGTLFESFSGYVVAECAKARVKERKTFYPSVEFTGALRALPSNPSKLSEALADEMGLSLDELRRRSDLVQLTDLVVGTLGGALSLDAQNRGKQLLVERVAAFLADTYSLPLERALRRSRRLSLSCFPGPGRTPYAVSLAGVRRYGIELLRTTHDLQQLHLSTVGFRLDVAPLIKGAPVTSALSR